MDEITKNPGPSAEAIRAQLERILGHPEFHATEKMRDFLRFVVEQTLAGNDRQLKGFTIATEVFGRDEDFDAAQDPVVRIQAGRLRRAMERYYLVAGGRDPVHIDIPKGGYVPVFSEGPVSGLDPAAGDEAERGVARGGHEAQARVLVARGGPARGDGDAGLDGAEAGVDDFGFAGADVGLFDVEDMDHAEMDPADSSNFEDSAPIDPVDFQGAGAERAPHL